MDFTKTHLVLLIVSTTLLFAPTTYAVRTPQARVWTICKPTTNPLLCYKTLLPKALSTPKFNMYKAVDVEIQEAQAQVVKTVAKIANSIFTSSDKNIANALTICKEQYGNMVDSLIEVITLVSKRNAVEARFKFSAFISYHSSCEQAFVESKNAIPPFADDAKVVYDLGANILDILKAIEDRETRLAHH
ncbi:pectinesterase inhibitor [Trifolium medium]|uniref:Pectinesterase inhibitor n=1 Tax=Trifolium medium TaxID=97028 RepID=A0A392M7T4_9FABA|nr:pectinesterase inhibitor [Trifolium medium]